MFSDRGTSAIKFIRWLKQFCVSYQPNKAVISQTSVDADEEALLRYPPFVKGFPVTPVEFLLFHQSELLGSLRGSLGYSMEEFKEWVLPVIQCYAAFVHHLPASESHHHRGAGGLLHHGLEVAFWAVQSSEGVIFPLPEVLSQRRLVEPLWRLATCFAGLLHDVGKPLSDIRVTDRDGQITWDPYLESLLSWARRHQLSRYFIRWHEQRYRRHEQFSLLALHQVLPPESLQRLSTAGPELLRALLEAMSGVGGESLLSKLVAKADQESVSRDLKQSRLAGDAATYGVPVERYLFDAMRRLLASGAWQVNQPNSRVWHLLQGVFINWHQGATEVLELLTQDGVAGIPRDLDTLADIMLERGFARPCIQQRPGEDPLTFRYWRITVPITKGEVTAQKILLLLQLDHPALLFTASPPAPLAGALLDQPQLQEATVIQEITEPVLVIEQGALHDSVIAPKQKITPEMPSEHSSGTLAQSAYDALIALIDSTGAAAETLLAALSSLLQAQGLGLSIHIVGSKVIIPYPEGAALLGVPSEVMHRLWAAGVIIPDAILPGRKVHTIGEQKALLFSPQFCAAIIGLYKELPVPPADISRTVESSAPPVEASVSTTPKSEVGCDQNTATVIQQLKQQIQQGQGRWLSTPVQSLAGDWVTSDQALDRLIADYPAQFDKKTLIYNINLNRKKPLLRWQASKLYLKQEEGDRV